MTLAVWIFSPEVLTKEFSSPRFTEDVPLSGDTLMKNQFVLWGITGILSSVLLWRARGWRLLGPGQWSTRKAIGIGIAIGCGLRVLLGTYLKIVPMEPLATAKLSPMTSSLMLTVLHHFGAIGLIASTAIFVPIMEEILFRGVLLGAFARHIPFWAANLLQSIGFALVHEELKLAPFFVGFAFFNGILVRKSNGLMPAIVLHAFNNLLVASGVILLKNHGLL
jgi:membrane protease YdiL (CAAX protease family)